MESRSQRSNVSNSKTRSVNPDAGKNIFDSIVSEFASNPLVSKRMNLDFNSNDSDKKSDQET